MGNLQFQPPPESLIQNYINRPQPAEIASQGLQQGLQGYLQFKQQEASQRSAATKSVIDLIAQDPELLNSPFGKRLLKQSGGDLGGYQPPSLSTGTAPSPSAAPQSPTPSPTMTPMDAQGNPVAPPQGPMNAPQQGPQMPGQSVAPPASGMGSASPIIDHWNATMGAGQGAQPQASAPPIQAPTPSAVPPAPSQAQIQGIMGRGKLGKSAVEDYGKGLDISKKIEGMGTKRIPFEDVGTTFMAANEQALGDKLVSDAKAQGLNYVPEEKMNLALKGLGVKNQGMRGSAIDSMAETRQIALRDSLNKEARQVLNPLFQSGEGKSQMQVLNRIGRAEPLIAQMMAQKGGGDVRQMRELATSFDRVLKGGGTQAQSQIDELMPQTAKGKFAHWQEWFTNNPTGTEQQAFIQRTADSLAREKTTIQGQVKNMAEKNAPTLRVLKQHYPEDYKAHLASVMGNPQLTGGNIPTISDDNAFNALESGAQFKDPSGQVHTKK